MKITKTARCFGCVILLSIGNAAIAADVDVQRLAKAVTLYASFDRAIIADYAEGDPKVYTQYD